jgi:hypothetical protein
MIAMGPHEHFIDPEDAQVDQKYYLARHIFAIH